MKYSPYSILFEKYDLVNEATTYQLPSSPKYYMADFYMLSLISTIDFDRLLQPTPANPQGVISAIRGEKYKDDIDYAKSVLYPRLQKIILEDTFYSITCEAYHAAEILTSQESNYEVTSVMPTWYKQLMRYVIKYINTNTFDSDRDQRGSGSSVREEKSYPQKYEAVIKFLTSKGISKTSYIEITTKLFRDDNVWVDNTSYGGEAWAQIGEAWLQLNAIAPTDYNKLAVYIDHIYDLEHNTGSVFDKIQRYHQELELNKNASGNRLLPTGNSYFQGYQWIGELLDFKAAINNPFDLLPRTSSSMQKLASPVLKAAGYTRETMQNPDEQYHYKKENENEFYSTEYWTDRNGFLNREGKPALIRYSTKANGTRFLEQEYYFKHGNLHRIGAPASIIYSPDSPEPSSMTYYVDGKIHREDGPAVYYNYGTGKTQEEYYLHGLKVSKEEIKLYHTNKAEYEKRHKTKSIQPAPVFKIDRSNATSWVSDTERLLVEAIVYKINSFSKSYIENVMMQVYPNSPYSSLLPHSGLGKISENYLNNDLPKFLKLYVQKDRYDKAYRKILELVNDITGDMARDSVWDKDGVYRGPKSEEYGKSYEAFNDTNYLKINVRRNERFQEINRLLGVEFYLTQIAGTT